MKRKLLLPSVITSIFLVYACSDFFELTLTKKAITLVAPGNGATLSTPAVTFWWDSVPGATKYEVQIVSPSFTNIQYLVVDSTISGGVLFSYTLTPGKYQWRMRAINSSSSTSLCDPYSFSVDSSLNLANQAVQIFSPINNYGSSYLTNKFSVNFSWSPVAYANSYLFQIVGPGVNYHNDTASTNISYTFPNGGTYTWSVQAINNNSTSVANQYTIYIDNYFPTPPTPTSPGNGSTTSTGVSFVTFQWAAQQPETLGAISITDSLYVFNDPNLDSTFLAVRPGSTSLIDSGFAVGHTYYWQISAIDTAGNRSISSPYHFTFQ
jgi:predicted secreted protein